MPKDPSAAKKLNFELQISDNKISVKPHDDETNIFFKKAWFQIVH